MTILSNDPLFSCKTSEEKPNRKERVELLPCFLAYQVSESAQLVNTRKVFFAFGFQW